MCESNILEKIKKLLALADTQRNNSDQEAMRALEMAQKLMAKHGVETSDLEELERDESDIIHVECEHKWDAGFRKSLSVIISSNYRCKVYISGRGKVTFIGVREDAMIAKAAFEFAYRFIYRRGNQEYERVKKEGYSGRDVFNSYALGFLAGLKEILGAQSKALMIVTPDTVIKAFDNMNLKKGSGGIRSNGYYQDIYNNGYNDAKDQYGKKALTTGGNK